MSYGNPVMSRLRSSSRTLVPESSSRLDGSCGQVRGEAVVSQTVQKNVGSSLIGVTPMSLTVYLSNISCASYGP